MDTRKITRGLLSPCGPATCLLRKKMSARGSFFPSFFFSMLHHAFLENIPGPHALHSHASRCSNWSRIKNTPAAICLLVPITVSGTFCTNYICTNYICNLKNMQSHTHDLILKSHPPHLSVTQSAQTKKYSQPPGIILGMPERFTG